MVGGEVRIEKANKVAVANEADVAYSDLVVDPQDSAPTEHDRDTGFRVAPNRYHSERGP